MRTDMLSVPKRLQLRIFFLIIVVVSFACLPIIILGLSNAEEALVNEKYEHLSSVASSRSHQIERMIEIWISNLNLVSSRTQLRLSIREMQNKGSQSHLNKVNRILDDAISNIPEMKHITIISKKGNIIASTENDLSKLQESVSSKFSKYKSEGTVHSIHPGEKRKPLLSITSPMMLEGKYLGVVWSEVIIDDLYSITSDQTGLGRSGEVVIVGDTKRLGKVVLAPTRAAKDIAFNRSFSKKNADFLSKIISEKDDQNKERFVVDYNDHLTLYASSKIVGLDWALMAKMDYSEIKEPIIQARKDMFLIVFFVIAVALVISYLIAVNLTRKVSSAESEIKSILETAGDAILLVEKSGLLVSMNEAAEKLFKIDRFDIIDKSVFDLTPSLLRKVYSKILKNLSKDSSYLPIKQVEVWGKTRAGKKFRIELAVSKTQADGTTRFVMVCRDISERRSIEMQMKSALDTHEKTIELQRQFVSMASHEFRTPLAIISGSIQHLERSRKQITSDYLISKTAKVRTALDRINRLINSTLSLSKMNAGQVELEISDCNIKNLLEHIHDYFQDITKEHVIIATYEKLPDRIKVDAGIIEQIIGNLISNAIKYSPETKNIYLHAKECSGVVEISITDEGMGIPENDLPHLFDCFYRSQNSHGIPGTGVGLHLVKRFTEMHGGHVKVQTEENRGSCFTLYFPVSGPEGYSHWITSAA